MVPKDSAARDIGQDSATDPNTDAAQIIDLSDVAESEIPSTVLDLIEVNWEKTKLIKILRKYRGEDWSYLKPRIRISDEDRKEMEEEEVAQRAMGHAREDLARPHKKRIEAYRIELTLKGSGRNNRRTVQFRIKPSADGPQLVPHRSEDERELLGQLRSFLTEQHEMTMRATESCCKLTEAVAKVVDKLGDNMNAAAEAIANTGANAVAKAAVEAEASVEAERIRNQTARRSQAFDMLALVLPTAFTTWAAVNHGVNVPNPTAANADGPTATKGGKLTIGAQLGTWIGSIPKEKLEAMRESLGSRGRDLMDSAVKAETDEAARAILFELRDHLMENGGEKVKTLGMILGPHAIAFTSILSQL